MNHAIAVQRLANQNLANGRRGGPAEVVRWLGAVQGQEYPFAKWAVGLRMRTAITDTKIERAFDEGAILRTHVLRPTWHFVVPGDIRWMLELTAPRIQRAMASYNRRLELDAPTLNRALRIIERALGDGRHLTRAEIAAKLEEEGIVVRVQRLAHVVMHAELERVICSGARRGKQFTYALLAGRAPAARSLTHECTQIRSESSLDELPLAGGDDGSETLVSDASRGPSTLEPARKLSVPLCLQMKTRAVIPVR